MKSTIRVACLAAILLAAALPAVAYDTAACAVPPPEDDPATAPVRSQAELDAWLARCPSPLDLMTPGARTRFLATLTFNDRGLSVFSPDELEAELSRDELREVVALFGLQAPASSGLLPEEARHLRLARAQDVDDPTGDIERRFDQWDEVARQSPHEADARPGERLGAVYDALFPEAGRARDIQAAGSHALRLLFRAAGRTGHDTLDPRHVDAAQHLFEALERRGLSTRGDTAQQHRLLIRVARLDQARAFARRHAAAGLTPLPPIRDTADLDPATPSVLRVSDAGDALLHEPVDLAPVRIVVVAGLGCRFSQAAAHAIPRDPDLGPIFRRHAVWLASPHHLEHLGALVRWNEANPEAMLVIAASPARWPMLDLDTVPQFHVFRDGERIESVSSWPLEEGNREALLAALQRAGLADGPSMPP